MAFVTMSYGEPNAPALRLPQTVRPLRYSAFLRLAPGQDRFSGDIRIDLDIAQPASVIWLNAKALEFRGGSIFQGDVSLPVEFQSAANDFLGVKAPSALRPGRARLEISYTGEISRTLTDGAFQQHQGNDWYVFTKFEPVTARRVFPCFDEPSFKVPWQLTLNVPKDMKEFSNTAVISEEPRENNTKSIRFAETKPLPSYLVAFAVGPFDVVPVPPVGRNRRPGNIIVPRGRSSEAAYAASITPKLIELLEQYFGTPYPYDKLDQIVVPLTTAWGAMENAGLIAYGDFLLAPPRQDTELRQRGRAGVMEHEMSHQWFGDLVTTAWRDDIWLNESFASWLSSKLLNEWKPEWNIKADAARSTYVMRSDSLTTARKIRQPIEAPGDIANAFDGITYGKGEAVIGMFENYVGADAFQKAVRRYLQQHAWGNATASDLLAAIDQTSPEKHAGEAFSTFLNQVGFPLVSVTQECAQDGPAPPLLHLSQTRFRPVGSPASTDQFWQVPVCAVWRDSAGVHRKCTLLTKASDVFTLDTARECPMWLSIDANAAGYYAISYGPSMLDHLVPGIWQLQSAERAATFRNIQLMFSSGLGNLQRELMFVDEVSRGNDLGLIRQSADLVGSVNNFVPEALHNRYAAWIRKLYGSRAHELGWQPKAGDGQETRLLRIEIVPLVATRGNDPQLQKQAQELARRWLKDRSVLDTDMVVPVLSSAAWNGTRAYFDELVTAIKTTKVQRERLWIGQALGSFRDPTLARAALQLFFEKGIDPRELQSNVFGAPPEMRQLVWDFIEHNFDRLNTTLPGARGIPFGAMLPLSASGFCDAAHRDQVSAFFEPRMKNLPGAARNLANALETIRLCSARAELVQPAVAAFLQRQ
ncbi:MAG TPA: M1 family aminopeptidase [Bryobacteraceae bacterium]